MHQGPPGRSCREVRAVGEDLGETSPRERGRTLDDGVRVVDEDLETADGIVEFFDTGGEELTDELHAAVAAGSQRHRRVERRHVGDRGAAALPDLGLEEGSAKPDSGYS